MSQTFIYIMHDNKSINFLDFKSKTGCVFELTLRSSEFQNFRMFDNNKLEKTCVREFPHVACFCTNTDVLEQSIEDIITFCNEKVMTSELTSFKIIVDTFECMHDGLITYLPDSYVDYAF